MGVTSATLNGLRCTSARATLPAWGCWYAEAKLDGEHALSGAVTLKIADLTLVGTVLSGGAQLGRSAYRIVGGKGGWGRTLPAKGYANDAGVKLSTVIGDAAQEAGETIGVISTSTRLGPAWARESGPASEVLNLAVPHGWYVDEAGVTQIGARAAGTLPAKVTRVAPVDKARGKVVLASDSIATILPGVVVDGLTATEVQHDVSADSGLRSTVWGGDGGGPIDRFRAIARQLDPERSYRGWTEYRVGEVEGTRLSLQPVRSSSGMPFLKRVPVRPGIAGCKAVVAVGARVLVGFVDSDPARPFVGFFEDEDGDGFLPTSLTFFDGSAYLARVGDSIAITPTQVTAAGLAAGATAVTAVSNLVGTITSGSTKVKCG